VGNSPDALNDMMRVNAANKPPCLTGSFTKTLSDPYEVAIKPWIDRTINRTDVIYSIGYSHNNKIITPLHQAENMTCLLNLWCLAQEESPSLNLQSNHPFQADSTRLANYFEFFGH
jgi:hypothetical protein